MRLEVVIICLFLLGCAQIIAPTGGEKDVTPPVMIVSEILEYAEKPKNTTIVFKFDEYIQLHKWDEYFFVSPPLKQINKTVQGKQLSVIVKDSLTQNRIYHFSLNSCIKDNNEGNILDSLNYQLNQNNSPDTFSISGNLKEAYTLSVINNAWIMLFSDTTNDSLIFKETPAYISKTDKNGFFKFPNLKASDYIVVALTGLDFIYEPGEKMGFIDEIVSSRGDSLLTIFAFDPEYEINREDVLINADSIILNDDNMDSIVQNINTSHGKLEIISNAPPNCIFQLLQGEEIIKEAYFTNKPYIIDSIIVGNYNLKYIKDTNNDNVWNTGSWQNKTQPERVVNYPSEVIIRFNWDLSLEWIIE